ncbi:MAG: DUF4111 domain-containing protein [Lachnospiraceae bacterium]|nr:DUF4111 domain-containing protein [Lachnospiraceae bacterium]
MTGYEKLAEEFVQGSKNILGSSLVGVYLHGSAAMGCFRQEKSDIDFLVVVGNDISDEKKKQYMDMVVELNKKAPAKGIELSIVKEKVCTPFVYPTPFELHFSNAHLAWYLSNPKEYVEKMKGTDKDLAAHFMITYHRGKTLYGKEIKEVFSEIDSTYYFDSIWSDIECAGEDILDNPMYITLNLCRVAAYVKENLILSKKEGGEWGLSNVPHRYSSLILAALEEYASGKEMPCDAALEQEYAEYMLEQIRRLPVFMS